jgi:hypothetical protein
MNKRQEPCPQDAETLRATIEELLAERARYVAALARSHALIERLLALDEAYAADANDSTASPTPRQA